MSLRDELDDIFAYTPEVRSIAVDKHADLNGQSAVEVTVFLEDRYVTGTFATERPGSFGGIDFSSEKNVPSLMYAKVRSVLDGKSEL